jgi:hypothetical protein
MDKCLRGLNAMFTTNCFLTVVIVRSRRQIRFVLNFGSDFQTLT